MKRNQIAKCDRWIRNRRIGFVTAALIAIASIFATSGCSSEKRDKEPIVTVQASQVEKTTIQHVVTSQAIVYPREQSAIVPKISAPVEKFLVIRGSPVHKGQLLAILENHDLSAAAQDSKGALDQAQAAYETTTAASVPEELKKAEADEQQANQALNAQEKIFESRQQLYEQGALPRKELDQSRVDYTTASNQYAIAKQHLEALMKIGKPQELKSAAGQLESAKGKYQGAEAQLSYSEIRSPINGVITERPLYPGEMATAGTPLLTVMDLSTVIAKAHIPQSEAESLKAGDKGEMDVPGMAHPVEGRVTVVSPALDPNSTTVEVWFEAKNPKHEIRPGTSVQLSLIAQTVKDALIVPVSAILTAPDGSKSVMLAGSDGRAHQKAVKVGIRNGDDVQVVEGLTASDKVISNGAYALPDNTKITIASSEPQTEPAGGKPGIEQAKPAAGDSDEK
ncbi:MAG TPA: efflux RND transporter periplasmic adaptor subunit [Candidatus Sulfotelmatobacter sp.]|nr:efflux RND transporter periplasmic adaptor subunit [Candidatus Sulfotelmatobacter sp.]